MSASTSPPDDLQPKTDRALGAEALTGAGQVIGLLMVAMPQLDSDQIYAVVGPIIEAGKRLIERGQE